MNMKDTYALAVYRVVDKLKAKKIKGVDMYTCSDVIGCSFVVDKDIVLQDMLTVWKGGKI